MQNKLDYEIKRIIREKKARVDNLEQRLKGVSPLERLKAGMAYITDTDGNRIVCVSDLTENSKIKMIMKDGYALANIDKIVKES